MKGGWRSDEPRRMVVKKRSSSGCLIVKKKGDGGGEIGSSSSHLVFDSMKRKKRARMVMSDSGSSDEHFMPPCRKVGPETMRHYGNGFASYENASVEDREFVRMRDRAELAMSDRDGFVGRNGEDLIERKRNKLGSFEFNDYDDSDDEIMTARKQFDNVGVDFGRKPFSGSMSVARNMDMEYGTGSSKNLILDKRNKSYFDRMEALSLGDYGYRNRFKMNADESELTMSSLQNKYMGDLDSDKPIRVQGKNGVLKVMVNKMKKKGGPVLNFSNLEVKQTQCNSKIQEPIKMNIPVRSPRVEVPDKPDPSCRRHKDELNLHKLMPTKKSMSQNQDSEDNDTFLRLERKDIESCKSEKNLNTKGEKTPPEQLPPPKIKEAKVRRGSGTEKQRLRERIRGMLLEAGWTIDYRPRRNRDYLDAIYINPTGTAYWSIVKAYEALLKQLNEKEDDTKPTQISDEVLSQLTRRTKKKVEKEIRKKQQSASDSDEKDVALKKSSSTKLEEGSEDSDIHGEKQTSCPKLGGKSLKNKIGDKNGLLGVDSHQSENPCAGATLHRRHGRKSNKLDRCTLLVRSSSEVKNLETDGFIQFSGKRTLLSWLIDCGTVQLSEKVMYMNCRRTRVMLEGWITRDGIHCGCCSKILTVSKFEIHAGSKLRQPFQNIYLDSGVSLLQCQIDAWNSQENVEHIGFHVVDTDSNDPNDDTCGICGDGGDLICCDSCPSTFHWSCLYIQILPSGDWYCPNCTCKFCGAGVRDATQAEDASSRGLRACSMCERKYHKSCIQGVDAIDTIDSCHAFCGQKCKELFDHLQKYLGLKNELEAGFSWSLIRRIDADSESSAQGLPQQIENKSKLALALAVMNECFLPIVDRRSGANIIRNVLYNCRSNFSRLNFGGFYTAILERADEIICAVSIRFHGNQLAEMPFIGTRHIYRRQGMCRRLFNAIESVLQSIKVEKLVIPAIAEFRHAWTENFGFHPLEDSLRKETRSMNMLAFPGIDMLEKDLLGKEIVTKKETKARHFISPEGDYSAGQELREQNDDCLTSASRKNEVTGSCELLNSSSDRDLSCRLSICQTTCQLDDNRISDSSVKDQIRSCQDGGADVSVPSQEIQASAAAACADFGLANKTCESTSDVRFLPDSDTNKQRPDTENEPSTFMPDADGTHSDSQREDKSDEAPSKSSCRDDDTQSALVEGSDTHIASLKAIPYLAEMTLDNFDDQVNRIPDHSGPNPSSFHAIPPVQLHSNTSNKSKSIEGLSSETMHSEESTKS